MNNPLVSIIIPTYNHARFLKRALKSVVDQTYSNWEIIVIDNHSTDCTDEIITAFDDSRILQLKIHNNGVIAASRNAGIKRAKGEWIAFLDSDDFWGRDKLMLCLNMEKKDFIYHKMTTYQISKDNRILLTGNLDTRDISRDPYEELLNYGPSPQTSSILLKRKCLKVVGEFDTTADLIGGEDFDLWVRMARQGCSFGFINRNLGFYLRSEQSTTSPHKALKIMNYLGKKYFSNTFSDYPNWMHKTNIASNLKLMRFDAVYVYIMRICSERSLLRCTTIFFLLLRSIVRNKLL